VDNGSTIPSVIPTKPNQPVKPATPDKPVTVPPAKTAIKVFTAIGSEYPAGASPFSYRKVFENNHTYFIIAQKDDTYEKIAGDVQVAAVSLRKFNDVLDPHSQPVENEIVYIETKAKTHNNKVHIVQAGETLRYIAQRYGVQLHYIFKYNSLDENSIIHPGDQILLKH
jgi:LysM repeat protein